MRDTQVGGRPHLGRHPLVINEPHQASLFLPHSPPKAVSSEVIDLNREVSSRKKKKKMSCCGGNCGCGSGCKCGNGCGGCKMYPGLIENTSAPTEPLVMGMAPQKRAFEEFEMMEAGSENGCKCGANCTCNPCTCK